MPGFFGKLPARGDFVTRDLPRAFLSVFDDWFQQGIQSSKKELTDAWFDYYQVMPVWHFYIGEGVLGEAWLGTWIPSADKVNRSFPILMAARVSPVPNVGDFLGYRNWFVDSGDLLIQGLEGTVTFEQFCQECVDLVPEKEVAGQALLAEIVDDIQNSRATDDQVNQLDAKLARLKPFLGSGSNQEGEQLAPELLGLHINTDSCRNKMIRSTNAVFWSEGGENIAEQLVITEQLPEAREFAKFLRGFDTRA
ncbi:MAG: type VI secretion system protein ImpM [Candidatus Azotimanducaceae bacterium]|jgi:type VI secretion system protein ImpM